MIMHVLKKIAGLGLMLLLAFSVSAQQDDPAKRVIKFKIKNLEDSVVYLSSYFGKRQYYRDTAEVKNGEFAFQGKKFPSGIYSVIFEDKKTYFEFVVNEPMIQMETVKDDLVGSMKVKTSNENAKFFEFLQYSTKMQEPMKEMSKKVKAIESDSTADGRSVKEAQDLKDQLRKKQEEIVAYKEKFIQDNPSLLITRVFKASRDPKVADCPEGTDDKDCQTYQYRQFKAHYLDDMDFSDEALLRTPVFHNKLEYYFSKLVIQHPDTVNAEADKIVAATKGNKETYKYVVHYVTSTYEGKEIMGMDAVWVHMGMNYYCDDKAYWMDSTKLSEFCERCDRGKNLLIGKTAPDVILMDTMKIQDDSKGSWHSLHRTPSPYTLLVFWDSGCGHCKKTMPKIKKLYDDYKDKGLFVYAVGTELETKEWIEFVREKKLDWLNVSDSPEYPRPFRTAYDIQSTPHLYLLDENKKIIAKKLTPEQFGEFIDNDKKRKAEEKAKKIKEGKEKSMK